MSFNLTFALFPPPAGPLRYAPVPWDGELYGFPFYELRCDKVAPELVDRHLPAWQASLPGERACLVHTKIVPEATALGAALTRHGFYPVETLLTFQMTLSRYTRPFHPPSANTRCRWATPADLPQLTAIAQAVFTSDRFHLDPHLPPEKASQRYVRWIERSLQSGDAIFVLEDARANQIMGFVQTRETAAAPKTIDMTLAAVHHDYQSAGTGVLLYQEVLMASQARGYTVTTARASTNTIGSVRLLERHGYTTRAAQTTLHWFRAANA